MNDRDTDVDEIAPILRRGMFTKADTEALVGVAVAALQQEIARVTKDLEECENVLIATRHLYADNAANWKAENARLTDALEDIDRTCEIAGFPCIDPEDPDYTARPEALRVEMLSDEVTRLTRERDNVVTNAKVIVNTLTDRLAEATAILQDLELYPLHLHAPWCCVICGRHVKAHSSDCTIGNFLNRSVPNGRPLPGGPP